MFLVGGGIVLHNIPLIHHAITHWIHQISPEASTILMTLANGLCGIITGLIILAVVAGARLVKST
jgi:predicted DNA repair protein MutK